MRLTAGKDPSETSEVPITPLIDCVFLLIIFFLVTSMFKRFEMLIPIEMPDQTSSLSREASDASIRLGISRDGSTQEVARVSAGGDIDTLYEPIEDFAVYLKTLAGDQGAGVALEFFVELGTPTQKVIDVLDIAQLQGFDRVTVRTQPE